MGSAARSQPSAAALQLVPGRLRQRTGSQAGAGREEASPLKARPFNRQAALMTELRSPAASQPWLWSNCPCCRHRADETRAQQRQVTKPGQQQQKGCRREKVPSCYPEKSTAIALKLRHDPVF